MLTICELALLKIMHERISPNSMGMEYYARAFFALCLIRKASIRDVARITELDYKAAAHLLQNLQKANIVRESENEFEINLEENRLLELIEKHQKREFKWTIQKNPSKALKTTGQPLVYTIRAR